MEELKICYIWVEQFRNFENQGINFSSSEKFLFDHTSGELSLGDIKNLPANFYGDKIVDVSALIGKNGAGKSNALELLCKLLKSGRSAVKGNFFIIVKRDEQFICYHSITDFDPICNFAIRFEDYERGIDPLKIIYFSNVFDERNHNFDPDISDLSANKRYKFNRFLFANRGKTEFDKQINFIETESFKQLEIPTPNKIQIISKVWSSQMNSSMLRSAYGDFNEKLKSFTSLYRARLNEIKPNNKFYYLIVYSFFIETIKVITRNRIHSADLNNDRLANLIDRITNSKHERTESIAYDLVKWMYYFAEDITNGGLAASSKEILLYKKQINVLRELQELRNELEMDYDYEGRGNKNSEGFYFDYSYLNSPIFKDYVFLLDNNPSFEINWLGLSSGHKAYLNLFSLIYHEVKRVKKDNLLVCIDEGDLYLHPKWQIEFFDKLVTVLPMIFNGKIQIILTSHSPFLLSDLPKQSITIIDADKGNRIMDGIGFKHETFAGNIYNLYEEPFFLGGQRMSTFARKKINLIIEEIGAEHVSDLEIQKYISLIGDDIIRFHLEKRLRND